MDLRNLLSDSIKNHDENPRLTTNLLNNLIGKLEATKTNTATAFMGVNPTANLGSNYNPT